MNDLKLQESHPLDTHLRPIKVDDEVSALEISTQDVRVKNLQVSGTTTGVSASDDTKLPLAGGTMTGDIATSSNFALDSGGSITLDSATGAFISKNNGTEFSVANSAYAGMILGYTRIANDDTSSGNEVINLTSTLTVIQTGQGTNVSIAFVAPPSGNVEIQFTCYLYASSKTAEFALSDNTSFNEVAETHTYDAGAESSDETDYNSVYIPFAVTGLTAGTSYTYYIGAAETVSGTIRIFHGRNRGTGSHYPPITVKAVALPATITTGE